jgi:hypothetical protein
MIASFLRARAEDLRRSMSDDESEAALANPSTRFTGLDIQDLMPGCHLPTA